MVFRYRRDAGLDGLGAKKKKKVQAAGIVAFSPAPTLPTAPAILTPSSSVQAAAPTIQQMDAAATSAAVQSVRSVAAAARRQAESEWRQYRDSLKALDLNLRRGALPADTPQPQPPASDPSIAGRFPADAQRILERSLPEAYEIARNKDAEKAARDAASLYATGAVRQPNPAPVLPPSQTSNYDEALELSDPNAPGLEAPGEYVLQGGSGGAAGFPWKKILLVVAVGAAAWYAYRTFFKKK